MEENDIKENLLKTFEGQIFHSTIDSIAALGLKVSEKSSVAAQEMKPSEPENIQEVDVNLDVKEIIQRNSFDLDIIFIGETPADFVEGESGDLLSKMVVALDLPANRTMTLLLERESSNSLDIIQNALAENSPKAVVTLGAYATNLMLDKKTKLSQIHGKEQKYIHQDISYSFFPIFHPDYLNINPNMKRTAWNDLKKVLEFLSK